MRDLSNLVPGPVPTSQQSGTEQTGPDLPGPGADYAHLVGPSGAREPRPGQAAADRPGTSYGGWTVV